MKITIEDGNIVRTYEGVASELSIEPDVIRRTARFSGDFIGYERTGTGLLTVKFMFVNGPDDQTWSTSKHKRG